MLRNIILSFVSFGYKIFLSDRGSVYAKGLRKHDALSVKETRYQRTGENRASHDVYFSLNITPVAKPRRMR